MLPRILALASWALASPSCPFANAPKRNIMLLDSG